MTGPRLTAARELVTRLQAELEAAGLPLAHATIDANEVPSGARHGVVIVAPPELDYTASWNEVQVIWELHVIAGPPDNWIAAWDTIDTILEALAAAQFNISKAQPGAFQPLKGASLPAYTVTLNPLD